MLATWGNGCWNGCRIWEENYFAQLQESDCWVCVLWMVGIWYCIEVEKSTMVCYDSRCTVAELLCNRSLANVLYCNYTLKLKWNMDPSYPTENVRPGDGPDWRKKYTVFVDVKMEHAFFFGFIIFIYFLLCMWWWSLKTPNNWVPWAAAASIDGKSLKS